jgi:hypothetical protein
MRVTRFPPRGVVPGEDPDSPRGRTAEFLPEGVSERVFGCDGDRMLDRAHRSGPKEMTSCTLSSR